MNWDGWKMKATRVSARPTGVEWSRDALHYHIVLVSPNGATWIGHYSCGSMVPIAWAQEEIRSGRKLGVGASRYDTARLNWDSSRDSVTARAVRDRVCSLYRPAVADLVSSLINDAQCVESSGTFRGFCDDMGMEWANPADALDSWNGCLDAARFVQAAWPNEVDRRAVEDWAAEL